MFSLFNIGHYYRVDEPSQPRRHTDVPHVPRRLPSWSASRQLLGWSGPRSPRRTRLQRAITVADVRQLALRRVPRPIFDYVDGGAEDELSLSANRTAFDRVQFLPKVFRDVTDIDTSTDLLGTRSASPIALGPTGFTRMVHHSGELGAAWAANQAGVPYTLATLGTTSAAEIARVTADTARWFQLYPHKDQGATERLIGTVECLGFDALMVTVDTAVIGSKRRDQRHGLTVPPTVRARTLAAMATRPRWCLDVLTTEPLGFDMLQPRDGAPFTTALDSMFMQGITVDFLRWLRQRWSGTLAVKGISTVADAELAFALGVDAVVLSNHGGRQLDRTIAPISLVGEVRRAVGPSREILIDSGVRSGVDVAVAVASGANGCLIGRAYLYGLMAGGPLGVARVLDILDAELRRTMRLLGARSVAELTPDLLADLPVAAPARGTPLPEHPPGFAVPSPHHYSLESRTS